jgi:hypothetical protein
LSYNPESPVKVISEEARRMLTNMFFTSANGESFCKNLLCSIVFNNYEAEKLKLDPTFILFCIGTNKGELQRYRERPLMPPTPQLLLDRHSPYYSSLTSKELRRMFKLCCDIPQMECDSELRKVAEIARKYLIFVTVDYDETLKEFVMKQTCPPWADPRWSGLWSERQKTRPSDHKVKNEIDTWYFKMRRFVHTFNVH